MGQMQPYRSKYGDTITDLIARRGDIAAQGHLQSGAIWGNAIQNVGAIAGQAVGDYAQHQEQKKQAEIQAKRDRAFGAFIESGAWLDNPQAAIKESVRIYGPGGVKVGEGLLGAAKLIEAKKQGKEIDPKTARESLGAIADSILSAPPSAQPFLYKQATGLLGQLYPETADKYPPEFTPEIVPTLRGLAAQGQAGQKAPERIEQNGQFYERQANGAWAPAQGLPTEVPKAAVGSFEDYVQRRYPNATPEQVLQARKEYQQADDRPRDPLVQELARVRLDEAKRGAESRGAIPQEWKSVSGRAGMAMPEKRRNAFEATLASVAHDPQQMGDVIRQAAIEGENVDVKNQIIGRQSTIASLEDTRAMLAELKAKGVPTSWMAGTMEDLHRKLGSSTNPEYVALSNRLMGTLINYRRAATGVSFGAKESGDYERMFPNYRNNPPVNEALIKGLLREMKSYDKTYWEHKLGKEGAKLVGVVKDEPSAASLPATTKSELDRIFGGGK